jgi:hypothetical protein
MAAYLFLLFALITRVVPHPGLWSFTAVGAMLIYFGARRSWREFAIPFAALIAADFILTTYFYHYAFRPQDYLLTWAWYAMAFALGRILLSARASFIRVAASALLGPTSFFVLSNFAVWAMDSASTMYPRSFAGLNMSFVAGLPFYRNDLVATSIFLAIAFGVPALVRRTVDSRTPEQVPVPVSSRIPRG